MKLASTVFGLAFMGLASLASAAPVTFGQFTEVNGSNAFHFNNNVASASFVAATPVNFSFSNVSGLPVELQGIQGATLTLTASTTTAATAPTASTLRQRFDTFVHSIVRNSPIDGKSNLLTVDLTPAAINGAKAALAGSKNGGAAQLAGGTGAGLTVAFTSDFVDFSDSEVRDIALSFSSVTPHLLKSGHFLKTFTAAGTGTFSADVAPTFIPSIPEPASLSLLVAAAGLLVRRRNA